ncbi:non-structural maintenance of chromosomes element 4 homolog A-like [Clytia hemisphaerica]|uniref:Non-structural maintenance of chromosomes element 4 n=1 Tax=Clytia hemisphaerica TaxID=252671 RepID=A0A7M5UR16_9CNID
MGDDKENVPKDSKLSEYSIYDEDEERRKVRAEYRHLNQISEENAEEIIRPTSTKISEIIKVGEDLFSKVRRPREAVHDSAHLLYLSKKSREQAQELKTDIVAFDNVTFIKKLIGSVNGYQLTGCSEEDDDEIDLPKDAWKTLGRKAVSLFKKAPAFEFLLGPLVIEVQVKEKVVRQRKKDENVATKKLEQIVSVEKQEEATTKEVDRIYKILKKKTKDGSRPICFFNFAVNPESFGQTVENIFHIAFLIKDSRVIVDFDEDDIPTINLNKNRTEEHTSETQRKQVVMPLTMKEWKELVEVYDIQESTIPTRAKIH